MFKHSSLWTEVVQQTMGIPKPDQFCGATSVMPYVIFDNAAFGLTNFLMIPYAGNHLSKKRNIFNWLTLARRYVECTFGIFSNKWRILHRPLDVSVDFADVVKACCVLHNFVNDRDGFQLEDTLVIEGFEDMEIEIDNVGSRVNVQKIRNTFADYFVSNKDKIPWQYTAIRNT